MARARFKEGVDYYDKGQFEAARAAFLQAYALKKHPAVLLNLAWSCLKSGHVLEGERYFKQFLAEGGEITDKQRADANDGLTQAHAKLGRLEVAAAPAGTEVSVDGESVGVTPLAEPTFVEAGARSVRMRAPDGTILNENVTAVAGERSVVRFARPAPGAPAAAVAPAPAPAPAPTPTAAPTPAPAPAAPPPRAQEPQAAPSAPAAATTPVNPPPAAEHGGEGMSIIPFVVGGALVAASAAVAIVMKISRDSAQSKADDLGKQISHAEQPLGINPPRCSSLPSTTPSAIVSACGTWNNDNSIVNEDATIANVAIGVGVAALVGTGVYAIVYATQPKASGVHATVTPLVGPSFRGLSFEATF
jgi:hypothetical protein